MNSAHPLLFRLQQDFPALTFTAGELFAWQPQHQTIIFNPSAPHMCEQLLHEVAHAVLQHRQYQRDSGLIDLEREAWEYVVSHLAPQYGIALSMDDDIVQDALDTYRQWLHDRSTCPECGATGLQSHTKEYRCLHCGQRWRANGATHCRLRRFRTATSKEHSPKASAAS